MWISIPKRHIVVFDKDLFQRSPRKNFDVVMEPFLYGPFIRLLSALLEDEQRAQYNPSHSHMRDRPIYLLPPKLGDCGVYTLKYIECHALGIEFSKKDFAKPNGKSMRDKMAVDIFQELPNVHEFENKDMDDILGTYDV
uniref:Ubiquitin-like protease family profile domain-containing protein n=1 Tax=Brassica oleracea TaxID=3712 RepID=A0A3P6DNT4_BRAOL|nr:unnamed protein product [Brassica oleracea]